MAARSKRDEGLPARELRAISRAIADPRRFEILQRIASGKCSACTDLRAAFPITPATLSHHLKELESAGLIDIERRGKFVDAVFRRDLWERYLGALKKL